MRRIIKPEVLLVMLLILFCFCSENNHLGGDCEYRNIPGKAVIFSITDAPDISFNCPNEPKVIKFNFRPDNLEDIDNYLFPNWTDSNKLITIHNGMNPSNYWVIRNRIDIDDEFICFRNEILKGTCTPVIFDFPDLDLFPEKNCE